MCTRTQSRLRAVVLRGRPRGASSRHCGRRRGVAALRPDSISLLRALVRVLRPAARARFERATPSVSFALDIHVHEPLAALVHLALRLTRVRARQFLPRRAVARSDRLPRSEALLRAARNLRCELARRAALRPVLEARGSNDVPVVLLQEAAPLSWVEDKELERGRRRTGRRASESERARGAGRWRTCV